MNVYLLLTLGVKSLLGMKIVLPEYLTGQELASTPYLSSSSTEFFIPNVTIVRLDPNYEDLICNEETFPYKDMGIGGPKALYIPDGTPCYPDDVAHLSHKAGFVAQIHISGLLPVGMGCVNEWRQNDAPIPMVLTWYYSPILNNVTHVDLFPTENYYTSLSFYLWWIPANVVLGICSVIQTAVSALWLSSHFQGFQKINEAQIVMILTIIGGLASCVVSIDPFGLNHIIPSPVYRSFGAVSGQCGLLSTFFVALTLHRMYVKSNNLTASYFTPSMICLMFTVSLFTMIEIASAYVYVNHLNFKWLLVVASMNSMISMLIVAIYFFVMKKRVLTAIAYAHMEYQTNVLENRKSYRKYLKCRLTPRNSGQSREENEKTT